MKFGEPFDGKCLPKDMKHLINSFHAEGLNPLLFEAIKRYNISLKSIYEARQMDDEA
jgi:UDP-glucose 6-dehydrogenase